MIVNQNNQGFELIFKTTVGDEIYLNKDTIFVKFNSKRNGIISSWLNGGYSEDLLGVFNHQLSQENIDKLGEGGILDYLKEISLDFSNDFCLKENKTSGLVTSADMKKYSIVKETYKEIEVIAITTAGVRVNAVSAGDNASFYEINDTYEFIESDFKNKLGTINTILLINTKLDESNLLIAEMTAVEAKAVALRELMVGSNYSDNIATGTGTDGIAIFSNLEGINSCENASKHSKLGELIAKAVIKSVKESLEKLQWLSPSYQLNALVRLDRFDLNLDDFYSNFLNISKENDKKEFIADLIKDSHNPELVSYLSLIIHIVDQYKCGLLSKKTAILVSESILNNQLNKEKWSSINKLIKYFIKSSLV